MAGCGCCAFDCNKTITFSGLTYCCNFSFIVSQYGKITTGLGAHSLIGPTGTCSFCRQDEDVLTASYYGRFNSTCTGSVVSTLTDTTTIRVALISGSWYVMATTRFFGAIPGVDEFLFLGSTPDPWVSPMSNEIAACTDTVVVFHGSNPLLDCLGYNPGTYIVDSFGGTALIS